MRKLLTVREFDTITANDDFESDKNFKYADAAMFQELIAFIHDFAKDEENADALDFMRISYKRNVGEVITIRNYVGLIQMKSGNQIEILPKLDFNNGDGSEDTNRKIFLKMLMSMKNFPGKIFSNADLRVHRMSLYEIFINMYIQEVRRLVKRGIKSDYVLKEGNQQFFKGKLLTSQQIRKNIVHGERFYVEYSEFNTNRAENRIIKATLLKLQKLTNSAQNSKEIRQLVIAFENVNQTINPERDFQMVKINRNTKDYEMLIQWSKVFLMNKSFSTFAGGNSSRALLFPMEKVYESFVASKVKKMLEPLGWEVLTQDKRYYLFTEPREQFSLRPDIVCQKNGRIVIMDTKWKRLIDKEKANYGISQSDMYQMYAYSKKYNTSEIWLLYPLSDEMRGHSRIAFKSDDNTNVNVFFVNVGKIEDADDENSLLALIYEMEEYSRNE